MKHNFFFFFFKRCPGRGANLGSFWFSFIFSLQSSALDHSATAPPMKHNFCGCKSVIKIENYNLLVSYPSLTRRKNSSNRPHFEEVMTVLFLKKVFSSNFQFRSWLIWSCDESSTGHSWTRGQNSNNVIKLGWDSASKSWDEVQPQNGRPQKPVWEVVFLTLSSLEWCQPQQRSATF